MGRLGFCVVLVLISGFAFGKVKEYQYRARSVKGVKKPFAEYMENGCSGEYKYIEEEEEDDFCEKSEVESESGSVESQVQSESDSSSSNGKRSDETVQIATKAQFSANGSPITGSTKSPPD